MKRRALLSMFMTAPAAAIAAPEVIPAVAAEVSKNFITPLAKLSFPFLKKPETPVYAASLRGYQKQMLNSAWAFDAAELPGKGDIYLRAARSMGKSRIAEMQAEAARKQGKHVLIVTPESQWSQDLNRMQAEDRLARWRENFGKDIDWIRYENLGKEKYGKRRWPCPGLDEMGDSLNLDTKKDWAKTYFKDVADMMEAPDLNAPPKVTKRVREPEVVQDEPVYYGA